MCCKVDSGVSISIRAQLQDQDAVNQNGVHYLESIRINLRPDGSIQIPNPIAPVIDGRFLGIVNPLRDALLNSVMNVVAHQAGEAQPEGQEAVQENENNFVHYHFRNGVVLRMEALIQDVESNDRSGIHFLETTETILRPDGTIIVPDRMNAGIDDGRFEVIANALRNNLTNAVIQVIQNHSQAVEQRLQAVADIALLALNAPQAAPAA